ncbi:family 20 glycosylhydrolase [Neisseria dentiae]|nr:family 20 glycosylhydrolase [Neisseria dentiae]STZ50447.1 Beta-N-acetylhexosaminidase precursor [Neisseria dentiae]
MFPQLPFSRSRRLAAGLMLFALIFPTAACHGAEPEPQKAQSAPAAAQPRQAAKQNGLMLDTARRFYSEREIKKFIDMLAASGGQFLHLHFSDHENYALESALLGQTVETAKRSRSGVYTNPKTGKPFLSRRQMRTIIRYAAAKNIEIVPEVGSPNHMNGIFTLLTHKHGKDYVRALKSKMADDEIDITRPESVAFVKALIDETAETFNRSKHFHIGGDEFGYSAESNHEFIDYANTLAAHLAAKGLKTRMWNDGLINSTVGKLNRDIEITYWSYDGNPADKQAAQTRRAMRASLPELTAKGFSVLNYNSYYLYLVPNGKRDFAHDAGFSAQDIEKRWHLGVWDGENRSNATADTGRIIGAALAVWGENTGKMKNETIRRNTAAPLKAMMRKANAASAATP